MVEGFLKEITEVEYETEGREEKRALLSVFKDQGVSVELPRTRSVCHDFSKSVVEDGDKEIEEENVCDQQIHN